MLIQLLYLTAAVCAGCAVVLVIAVALYGGAEALARRLAPRLAIQHDSEPEPVPSCITWDVDTVEWSIDETAGEEG